MEKRFKAYAALAAVIIAVAGLLVRSASNSDEQQQPLETVQVKKSSIAPTLTVTGVIAADKIKLGSNASGKVEELYVHENDTVSAGQELLKIDGKSAKTELDIAIASLKSAKEQLKKLKKNKTDIDSEIFVQEIAVAKASADYEKARKIYDSIAAKKPTFTKTFITLPEIGTVSVEQEFDGKSAKTELDAMEASLRSAKERLNELKNKADFSSEISAQEIAVAKANADYEKANKTYDSTIVTSPIDGTVIDISVSVGDMTGGNSSSESDSGSLAAALITVADLSNQYIKVSVDQADIPKVKTGQAVKVSFDALSNQSFTGRITAMDPVPVTSQNVVTYTAIISLDEPDPAILLGMTADIEIDLGKKENILVVSNIAIRSREGEKTVTKVVDGQETEVVVETGISDSENTEITSGLLEGDKIVLRSLSRNTSQSTGGNFGGNSFGGGSRMMLPGGGR